VDWLARAIASAIFVAAYGLMFSVRVHRAAALVGAVAMMVAGTLLGFFPTEEALDSFVVLTS